MLTIVGMLWGQAALAVGELVLPRFVVYGEAVKRGFAYRVVASTALLPWSAAGEGVRRVGNVRAHLLGVSLEPGFAVAVLAPLVGCVLVGALAVSARGGWWRKGSAAIVLVVIAASSVLALQLADNVVAEREFFALVSSSETPHRSPAVISGAERFLMRHPYSRWRSEALRIGAMAAEASGDDLAAERRWERFGDSFRDATVPGVAYAEYSRARCWERLGWPGHAADHYRHAVSVIRARSDGIQSWIGSDGAMALARTERAQGRPLRAAYWTEKANDVSDSSWD